MPAMPEPRTITLDPPPFPELTLIFFEPAFPFPLCSLSSLSCLLAGMMCSIYTALEDYVQPISLIKLLVIFSRKCIFQK